MSTMKRWPRLAAFSRSLSGNSRNLDCYRRRRDFAGDGPRANLRVRLNQALAWRGQQFGKFAAPHRLVHVLAYPAWLPVLRAAVVAGTVVECRRSALLRRSRLKPDGKFWKTTPLIIDRYRAATISLDYYGDSVFNSLSDIAAMAMGFGLAAVLPVTVTIVLGVAMEAGMAYFIQRQSGAQCADAGPPD